MIRESKILAQQPGEAVRAAEKKQDRFHPVLKIPIS